MPDLSPAVREEALRRLRRIEGQVRGIQRMLAENRDCHEILHQLTAVRSATYQTSLLLVRNFAAECLKQKDERSPEEMVDDLLGVLNSVPEVLVAEQPES